MKTNDFVKAVLPVAVGFVKDIITDNKTDNNHHCKSIKVDKEKPEMDVYRDANKININVNMHINVYVGLGERTRSISGVSYADQY